MKQILLYSMYDVFNRNNEIFRPDSTLNRDDGLAPIRYLKAELALNGYDLNTIDQGNVMNCDYFLFFDTPEFIPSLESSYFLHYLKSEAFRQKMMLVLFEPPVVNPNNWNMAYHRYFGSIFTWNDHFAGSSNYVKIHFPHGCLQYEPIAFQQKKECVMVNGDHHSSHPQELYSERRRAIRFFEEHHSDAFDLYGFSWNSSINPSYRGRISEKGEVLRNYKFAICFENAHGLPGYITEKLFDCFRAGCVPVYLGAPNITDYVPNDTFIDFRLFESYEVLFSYLKAMSEEEYNFYLQRINEYLNSVAYSSRFSNEAFSQSIIQRIQKLEKQDGASL